MKNVQEFRHIFTNKNLRQKTSDNNVFFYIQGGIKIIFYVFFAFTFFFSVKKESGLGNKL